MLASCDKMVLSSITPNEWLQLDDETGGSMVSSGRAVEMIKPSVQQEQLQQPLKCPRCDSSNTKFCYYNNYSLSQPRHFCKACKRYWTRGGTLRNVPVGGGYRKNKRVKRPSSTSTSSSSVGSESTSCVSTPSSVVNNIPKPKLLGSNISPANDSNSIFYGLPNSLYDHHSESHMSPLGFNFPSSTWASRSSNAIHQDYGSGFSSPSAANYQIQNMVSSSNSVLSNLSLLGSSPGLQQQKLVLGDLNKDIVSGPTSNLQGLLSFEGLQGMIMKDVKSEESEYQMVSNKMGNWGLVNQNNLIEPSIGSSNVNGSVWLNPMSVGSNWPHLTN